MNPTEAEVRLMQIAVEVCGQDGRVADVAARTKAVTEMYQALIKAILEARKP